MSSIDLMKVQVGKETTWGSKAAANKVLALAESCTINPEVKVKSWVKMGSLSPARKTAKTSKSAKASVGGSASFEQIGYWFEALCGAAEAVDDGEGNFTRNYAAPDAKFANPVPLTLEYGDGASGGPNYVMSGGLISKFNLTVKAGEDTAYKSDLLGKSVEPVASLTAASEPSEITPIMGADWSVALDSFGAQPGTTPLAATVLSAEISLETARQLRNGLGSLNPKTWSDRRWKGSLRMSLEFSAEAKAMLDAILSDNVVEKVVQLKAVNGDLSLALNFAGFVNTAPAVFTNDSGTLTVDFQLDAETDASGLGNWFTAVLVNKEATLF